MVLIKVRKSVVHEDVASKFLVKGELDPTLARFRWVVVSDFISAGPVRNGYLMADWIDFLTSSVVNYVFGNLRR